MVWGWDGLKHYFTEEARAARTLRDSRRDQAVDALIPFAQFRLGRNKEFAVSYLNATRANPGKYAASVFLNGVIGDMREKGESRRAAEDRVVSMILVNPARFAVDTHESLQTLIQHNIGLLVLAERRAEWAAAGAPRGPG